MLTIESYALFEGSLKRWFSDNMRSTVYRANKSMNDMEIVTAILKHPMVKEYKNKNFKIKVTDIRSYLLSNYKADIKETRIIEIVKAHLSDKLCLTTAKKTEITNKKNIIDNKEHLNSIKEKVKVIKGHIYIIKDNKCPKCNAKMNLKTTLLPLYISKPCITQNINDEIKVDIFFCNICNQYYIEEALYVSIKMKHKLGCLNTSYLKNPQNSSISKQENENNKRNNHINRDGILLENNLNIDFESDIKEINYRNIHANDNKYLNRNQESFLHKMGYNISDSNMSIERRRCILEQAVKCHGYGAVQDYIEFLIRDKEKQRNCLKYEKAIGIWKSDLSFLEKQRLAELS